jgi:hypothetical protein
MPLFFQKRINVLKKKRELIPAIIMLSCIPFYFFDFFSLKLDDGQKIIGTARFWLIGLTGDYGEYQQYFNSIGPNFLGGCVGLLICSLLFYIVFVVILILKKDTLTPNQYTVFSFLTCLFINCFYLSSVAITLLFYSNKYHVSYAVTGKGRMGWCVLLVILAQITSVVIQFLNVSEYVIAPNKAKKLEQITNIDLKDDNEKIEEKPIQKPIPTEIKYQHQWQCYLIGSKGEYRDGRIKVEDNDELIIGKDPSLCTVVIDKKYSKVSRKHCGVVKKGYNIYLKDYSTNGTFMSFDKQRVPKGTLYKIESGQRFNLANTENEFYCQIEK